MLLNTQTYQEGQTPPVITLPGDEGSVNDVRTPSAAVQDMQENWTKVTTLLGGTKAMRAAAQLYLPKWTNESPADYQARLKSSVLFNAFGHTVAGLGGKPFTRPLGWSADMPPDIVSWFPNIDLTGRSFHVFAQELFTTSLAYGLTHVLVDYPTTEGIVTVAQEKAAKARPYLIHVRADTVLGWRVDKSTGVEVLTQLRILECVEEANGPFATKTVEQVRVLTPGAWQTYRQNVKTLDWELYQQGTTSSKSISLITFYANRTGFMTAEPLLIDIADLNIKHWQATSDMYSVLHTASVPILTLIGIESNEEGSAPVVVGAKTALKLPAGSSAHFTEHSGKAVASGAAAIAALEEQMRLLGAELLVKKPGQATATQATLDTSQQRSELQSLTGIFEDVLDQIVAVMAQWGNVSAVLGTITVYKDFLLAADDAVQEALLFSAATAGVLSHQTFYEEMQRRDVLDTDRTWEEEQERIQSQPPPAPVGPAPQQVGNVQTPSSSVAGQLNG
jgi:hypothetical protein